MTPGHDQSRFTSNAPATRHAPMRRRQSVHSRRVFISSTSLDLRRHRQRVHDDLERMYQVPVDMAQFGAGAADATTVSYTELATADIVVLIVAWRYGFVPEGETRSVTELEYEEAKRLGLPIYVYLADPATEADDGPEALFPAETRQSEYAARLAAFRAQLSDSNATTYDTFDSPADLSARVLATLGRRLLRVEQVGRHALVEARALNRTTFDLGDDDAATFDYLTGPLQGAWKMATQALADASIGRSGKHGVIVLGEANAGKTRLALEAVIQALPDWLVLRWSEGFTAAELPPIGSLPSDGLVLFIDDLPNYAPLTQRGPEGQVVALASNPAATLRALVESITEPSLVIVATCRSEEETRTHAELEWLFTKLTLVRLPQFTSETQDPEAQRIIADFAAHGASHVHDWDGTLGSLVLGLSAKRAEYETLVARQSPAAEALRAMKLLTAAGVRAHTEQRLRAVCAKVFHHPSMAQNERVWQETVEELLRLQFARVAEDASAYTLVIRKDTYFDADKVIMDYPNPRDPGQLARHLTALQAVFITLEDTEGLFFLGNVFFRNAQYGKALAAFEQALSLKPELAIAWYNTGVALGALGRWDEALAACNHAVAIDPNLAAAWYNTGVALGRVGRWDEALAAYERAVALRPEHAATWHNMGVALGRVGRWDEALAAYERAVALRPEHATTWHNMGVALERLTRDEEALTAYERAVALRPEHATTWNNMGYALIGLNRYEDAVSAIDHALALEPENASFWDSRGEILLGAGRAKEALAAYEEALAREPGLASSREGKARALRALGRDTEALDGPASPPQES